MLTGSEIESRTSALLTVRRGLHAKMLQPYVRLYTGHLKLVNHKLSTTSIFKRLQLGVAHLIAAPGDNKFCRSPLLKTYEPSENFVTFNTNSSL
jgi:hypothetical protein